jgi:hypothetical protein
MDVGPGAGLNSRAVRVNRKRGGCGHPDQVAGQDKLVDGDRARARRVRVLAGGDLMLLDFDTTVVAVSSQPALFDCPRSRHRQRVIYEAHGQHDM